MNLSFSFALFGGKNGVGENAVRRAEFGFNSIQVPQRTEAADVSYRIVRCFAAPLSASFYSAQLRYFSVADVGMDPIRSASLYHGFDRFQ